MEDGAVVHEIPRMAARCASPNYGRDLSRDSRLIEPVLRPIARFMHVEAAGGIVLLTCTAIALVLANSRWSSQFAEFWETRAGFSIGPFELYKTLSHWINDGLMTIFFFLVGLEIKREIVFGELQELRKAALPAAAALGGMIAPALIYML